jgi:hypothetical protein
MSNNWSSAEIYYSLPEIWEQVQEMGEDMGLKMPSVGNGHRLMVLIKSTTDLTKPLLKLREKTRTTFGYPAINVGTKEEEIFQIKLTDPETPSAVLDSIQDVHLNPELSGIIHSFSKSAVRYQLVGARVEVIDHCSAWRSGYFIASQSSGTSAYQNMTLSLIRDKDNQTQFLAKKIKETQIGEIIKHKYQGKLAETIQKTVPSEEEIKELIENLDLKSRLEGHGGLNRHTSPYGSGKFSLTNTGRSLAAPKWELQLPSYQTYRKKMRTVVADDANDLIATINIQIEEQCRVWQNTPVKFFEMYRVMGLSL